MENYYVQGTMLKEKKAVIAVTLPEASEGNKYEIYDIYNLSDTKENKIVIHFKDCFGEPLIANDNLVSFIIDLKKEKFNMINFHKPIIVTFYHENKDLRDVNLSLEEIFKRGQLSHGASPDTTGKGTIREGEEDGV